jgi:hypothetical protein
LGAERGLVARGLWVSAALVGSLLLSVLIGVAVARFLPGTVDLRLAVGTLLVIPLWLGISCWSFLARSGGRTWLVVLLLSAVLATALWAAGSVA